MVFGFGLWYCRKQETNADYFLGGRTMHWLPVGLSLFATTFSSNSFVGLPAEAAYQDYHLLLAIWFVPLVVVPRLFRLSWKRAIAMRLPTSSVVLATPIVVVKVLRPLFRKDHLLCLPVPRPSTVTKS